MSFLNGLTKILFVNLFIQFFNDTVIFFVYFRNIYLFLTSILGMNLNVNTAVYVDVFVKEYY